MAATEAHDKKADARFIQEHMKVVHDDGSQHQPLNVRYFDGAEPSQPSSSWSEVASESNNGEEGLRHRRVPRPESRAASSVAEDDEKDDERSTRERYDELRTKVHINTVQERMGMIMNCYYAVLAVLFWGFYRSLRAHGHNQTVVIYGIMGFSLVALSYLADWLGKRLRIASPAWEANFGVVSGLSLALAVPILFATTFAFLWIKLFFQKSWRDMWLGMSEYIHVLDTD